MIAVNDVWEDALLTLADRREGRTRAADTLCPGFVRTSTSTTGRARRAVAVHHIGCVTRGALDSEARVGGTFTLLTQRAICRWGTASNTLFTRRL